MFLLPVKIGNNPGGELNNIQTIPKIALGPAAITEMHATDVFGLQVKLV